jgi:hypothetical protein
VRPSVATGLLAGDRGHWTSSVGFILGMCRVRVRERRRPGGGFWRSGPTLRQVADDPVAHLIAAEELAEMLADLRNW